MNNEIHSFAAVRSSASAPRNSTDPSRSDTSFARPNVVMIRPFFVPHIGLIRVFMRAVCQTRLDKECPCANFCKILETLENRRKLSEPVATRSNPWEILDPLEAHGNPRIFLDPWKLLEAVWKFLKSLDELRQIFLDLHTMIQ